MEQYISALLDHVDEATKDGASELRKHLQQRHKEVLKDVRRKRLCSYGQWCMLTCVVLMCYICVQVLTSSCVARIGMQQNSK